MCFFFIWREYPHHTILRAWMKTNKVTGEQLLSPTENIQDTDIPLMFIPTYSRTNPKFKELFSTQWSYLGRSSATREMGKQDFMITYRKPPSFKDMLVRARITQPTTTLIKGCNRLKTCKYCVKISQSGRIKNLNNNKSYNTIANGTCQSNNLIYCLEYNHWL